MFQQTSLKPQLLEAGAAALPIDPMHRRLWEQSRALIEANPKKSTPMGRQSDFADLLFEFAVRIIPIILKPLGIYSRGVRNALDVRVNGFELYFDNLPERFDGYRILHLTDLHLDFHPGLGAAIVDAISGCEAELCVFTGDYRAAKDGPHEHILEPLSQIIDAIRVVDGIYGTLGNHDDHHMVAPLEQMGMRILANEALVLTRGDDRIQVTGIDDVNRYYTPMADEALNQAISGFGIALVHSAEMAEVAAAAGHKLYLCGHTHGGQIALPGGRPVITRLSRHRRFASGLWHCGGMIGYTSPGAGASGVPVRYFTRPEVALITLRCRPDQT